MKLYELQQTFDEMTAQLKELDNCVSPDKNSEQYKTLWDDRAEIKGRISKLEKDGRCKVNIRVVGRNSARSQSREILATRSR